MNAMRERRRSSIPDHVWAKAHAEFPAAVGRDGLYGAAFFGHSHPHTKRTPASVWKGLVRRIMREWQA